MVAAPRFASPLSLWNEEEREEGPVFILLSRSPLLSNNDTFKKG